MRPDGTPKRRNIHVDIPLEIGLPHFVNDESTYEGGPLFVHFKLSLQSIVCHRGKSVNSGHYVALVKDNLIKTYHFQSQTQAENKNNYGTWLLFDDLAKDRVQKVDIAEALREESPYLLFYQVQPIDDALVPLRHPPPYSDITTDIRDKNASEKAPVTTEKPDIVTKVGENSSLEAANAEINAQIKSGPSPAEVATTNGQQAGTSEQSNISNDNDFNNKSSAQEAVPTNASTTPAPVDDMKSGYFGSRRTSKIGMRGSWSRASSQSGEGSRLSFTIGKRGIQTSNERNNVVAELGTQDRSKSDPKLSTTNERKLETNLSLMGNVPARSKSRKDSRRQRVSMQIERAMNEKLPDRQCSTM